MLCVVTCTGPLEKNQKEKKRKEKRRRKFNKSWLSGLLCFVNSLEKEKEK